MPDEGPLEHYLTVSHEPEPDIPEPAPEHSPGPWRERGIMLGLGFLLGCIGGVCAGLLGNVRRHAVAETIPF